ncbi:hypothetical protein [Candidatus Scalindua japonica]|uniref:hypothetical protein n=1 Tax=Candidatus Scalindua japonica TaxID=1284222 RepID=UPI0010568F1C|nr:hypothetical protein [Candidatus Scalindua japonica]
MKITDHVLRDSYRLMRFFVESSDGDQGVTGSVQTLKAYIDSITGGDGDTIMLVPGTYIRFCNQ